MAESALWDTVRKNLAPYGKLLRIESPMTPGTPDVLYCLLGSTGWFELKHLPEWPKRETTCLRIDHLKLEQVVFAEEWERAMGRAFVVLQVAREYLLLKPSTVRGIYDRLLTRADVTAQAVARGIGKFPTVAVVKAVQPPRAVPIDRSHLTMNDETDNDT